MFFSGIKNFRCLDKNSEATEFLDRINAKKNARSISTFDFTTLFTKIPHDKLIEVLCKMVDSIFNSPIRKCIAIGKKRAYWVKKGESKNTTYNVNQVKNGTYISDKQCIL